jgi:outer membrane protein OmpA-like peptidoglycan-associated protein
MDLRGSLKVHSQVDPEHPELSLVMNADAANSVQLFLVRTDTDARWSRSVIDGIINKTLRDNVRANQVRPIPRSFWSLLHSKCQPFSKLGNFIKQWDASTGAARSNARQSAAQEIINIVGNFKDPHRGTIFARFRSNLAQTIIVSGPGRRMTCFEWLREMVKEEMQILVKDPANKSLSEEALYARVSRGFRLLNIQPPGHFVYIFDFTAVGAQTGIFAHGGVYAFDVEIRRDVIKAGLRSADKTFNSSTRRTYAGIFAEVGIGISIKAEVGGGSGAPGRVECECFHSIEPEEFDEAGFYVEAFNVGKVTVGIPNVTLFGALFIQITVKEKPGRPEVVLEGTATKNPLKPGTKKKFSKVPSIGVDVTVAEISLGYGSLLLGKKPLPKKIEPGEDVRKRVATGKAVRTIDIYFQQDLGSFEESNRIDLEYRLAVERALFVTGEGALQLFGNASPEGTDKRNDNLSDARAAGVEQAVKDAFGADLALNDIEAKGRGSFEAVFIDKLLDPPEGRPLKPFELQRIQEEKASWPKYRRVDIIVQRVLAAQVIALGK